MRRASSYPAEVSTLTAPQPAPGRYRRRRHIVEAMRFDGHNGETVAAWCGGILGDRDGHPVIAMPHAMPPAYVGDYVVREHLHDGSHRHYGMRGRIFEHSYEPAPIVA
jgi:hypothetical protein